MPDMPDIDLTELRDAARVTLAALESYEDARRQVLGHVPAENGLTDRYLFDALARPDAETDLPARRIAYLAKMNPDGPLTPTRLKAIGDRAEAVAILSEIFEGAHAEKVAEGIDEEIHRDRLPAGLLGRLGDVIQRAHNAVQTLRRTHTAILRRIDAAGGNAPPSPPETKRFETKKESEMAHIAKEQHDDPVLGGASLVDAVSRLQGGGGAPGVIAAEAGAGSFDRMLAQRIGTVLGVPDMNGDAARSQPAGELLEKLQNGLSRSVTRGEDRGETRFRFDPVRARSDIGLSGTGAQGAQAIVAQTVRNLREPFRSALHSIGSERYRDDWQEGDDLRDAAMRGFDQLINEASAPTGPFGPHVDVIARQIAFDTLELAVLGDVIERDCLRELRLDDSDMDDDLEPGDGNNPDWIFWQDVLTRGEQEAVDRLVLPAGSQAEIATRDPDLAFLAPEANEAALVAALGHLRSAYRLLSRDSGAGAILGRIRVRNDAMATLASSLPMVLSASGLSTADQAAIYLGDGTRAIDLGRLLAWIEDTALEDRATLTRPDLNRSDLRRIQRVRQTQMREVNKLQDVELPGIPGNPYGAGRRELAELAALAQGIFADLTELLSGMRPDDDTLIADR